jgi:hypothetical protein
MDGFDVIEQLPFGGPREETAIVKGAHEAGTNAGRGIIGIRNFGISRH